MALSSKFSLPLLLILTSCCLSQCFLFEEGALGIVHWARRLQNDTCGPVNCVHGACAVTSTFPFYKCDCNSGWKSPLNESWIPCVIPNCSLNLSCNGNTSLTAPSPAVSVTSAAFSFCALPVCGDGQCVSTSNSSLSYDCKCNSGSSNLYNSSSGYCAPKCALGSDCASLNVTLGSSSSAPGLNQGTSQLYASALIIGGFLLLKTGW